MNTIVNTPKIIGFIDPSRFNYASRYAKPEEEREDTWYNSYLNRFTNTVDETQVGYNYWGKFKMSTVFTTAKVIKAEVYWYWSDTNDINKTLRKI